MLAWVVSLSLAPAAVRSPPLPPSLPPPLATTNADASELEVPPLRFLGDRQLMQPSPPLSLSSILDEHTTSKLSMLTRAMHAYGGIGIAAPQVGWWARVFCFGVEGGNARYSGAGEIPFTIWINPEIVWSSEHTNWMWEGCLSVPSIRGWVERPAECVLRGLDERGVEKEVRLEGLPARIAQHELDHLDGLLFPHRVEDKAYLVPQASFEARERWAEGWPSPGSRRTGPGELCEFK